MHLTWKHENVRSPDVLARQNNESSPFSQVFWSLPDRPIGYKSHSLNLDFISTSNIKKVVSQEELFFEVFTIQITSCNSKDKRLPISSWVETACMENVSFHRKEQVSNTIKLIVINQ